MKLIRKGGYREFCEKCNRRIVRGDDISCGMLPPTHTNEYGRITRHCSELDTCPKHFWERVF